MLINSIHSPPGQSSVSLPTASGRISLNATSPVIGVVLGSGWPGVGQLAGIHSPTGSSDSTRVMFRPGLLVHHALWTMMSFWSRSIM